MLAAKKKQLVKQKAKWAAVEDGDHNASITTYTQKKIVKLSYKRAYKLTLSARQTKTIICENSVDSDETARNQPSHQDLNCLPLSV